MYKYIIAKKLNMSQVFQDDGTVVPVTWVELTENTENVKEGDFVNITGKSKGRGFAGVMKRHGFGGGPATHGQSDRDRAPGSIGAATFPSKVLKGKKMPGRFGGKKITLKDKKVVKIDTNKLALSGPLPGSYGSKVKLVIKDNS